VIDKVAQREWEGRQGTLPKRHRVSLRVLELRAAQLVQLLPVDDARGRSNSGYKPIGGTLSKEDRIRRLMPLFEQAKIVLLPYCNQQSTTGAHPRS